MAAIVLHDEDAHEKRAGRKRQRQGEPIGHAERGIHRRDA